MFKRVLALAILAAVFVGCEEEKTPADKNFIPTGVYFNYGTEDTRTSISVVENKVSYFLWNAGDKLGVSCTQSNVTNKEVAVPAEFDGQNRAAFNTGIEFNGNATDHVFNLYYPYNSTNNVATFVKHNLAATQSGKVGIHDFMWDQVITTKENPNARSTMQHPFAYVRFYVVDTDDADDGVDVAKTVNSITISANGTLAGDFTADFNNFAKNEVTFAGSVSNSVTLNAEMPIIHKSAYANKEITNDYPVMIINPTGVTNSFDVTVHINGAAPVKTTFAMGSKTFEANNFYNIGLGGDFEKDNFTITVIDWERVTADVTFN